MRRDRLDIRQKELELEKIRLEVLKMEKDTYIELERKQRTLDKLREKDELKDDEDSSPGGHGTQKLE